MDTPSSPPPAPPELVDHGEQLWTSLFPKRPASWSTPPTSSAPPPAPSWFARTQAAFFRALPAYFEHLGAVIPGLVVAVLTGVLLGYLLGVVREEAQAAEGRSAGASLLDRQERDRVRAEAASARELVPPRSGTRDARAEAEDLRELTTLYEGFRTAQRALRSLEARHFGEAEATLRDATRQLAHLSGKVEGLVPVLQGMQKAQLASAIDLNVKRRALMATLGQLDALIGARRERADARASD